MLLLLGALPANAQEEADEENPYRPGLVATYSAAGLAATRLDETVAFDWQDAAPDPRLPAGEFSAIWRGRLWAQADGKYQLLCFAQGSVEVKLAGKTVLTGQAESPQWLSSQPLELTFDRHELEITYRRSGPRGQLALFWTGPEFRLEPIAARFLAHNKERSPSSEFERGRQLAAALRCAACHRDQSASVTPAPALDRLSGNVHEAWLVDWLSNHAAGSSPRRMPDLGLTRDEAAAVAAWLLREPATKVEVKLPADRPAKAKSKNGKKKGEEEPPKPTAGEGQRLLLTRGCLACHQLGELGESGLFGGGDLTKLAEKRPADFLIHWLSDPAAINRSHRMPQFTFTPDELKSLDLWWQEQGAKPAAGSAGRAGEAERLVTSLRCANCHVLKRNDAGLAAASLAPLTAKSNWSSSCATNADRAKGRPGYRLADEDRAALVVYYSQPRPGTKLSPQARGRDLLVQLNCLACHQREGIERNVAGTLRVPSRANEPISKNDGTGSVPAALQDRLVAVAENHAALAPLVPAMTPPALNGVGDKLLDAALADSIRRQGPPHRPYLLVQMPKFALSDAQLADLTAYFTATDRVPESSPHAPREASVSRSETATIAALTAAGPRLVTSDGLSCTSCHQIGSVPPAKAPLNARGPDISMLEKRIRREWYDRWCDNPARIVPRMEMPAVKIPVRGVLNEKVSDQLAAVWHILNTPGFEPPEPNPVRVLRQSGLPGE
ncbi:MAG TPA: c-type cytochrome, partial [Pirellulaceae bacterium]|nr:c-type cytochrome [Pirellulaceae bacterium]